MLVGEGIYLWPRLHDSWRALTEIHWGWLALCIVAQGLSLSGFGAMQKQLLHAAAVKVSHLKSVSVIYAATAMSVTLPAGQVFSTAFTYRETRRWGASPIIASWQLAISGVIAAAGLALLGVGGAALVGNSISPFTLIVTLGAAAALAYAAKYASSHPESVETLAGWVLHKVNAVRNNPPEAGMERVRQILGQLESVRLTKVDTALAALWALSHRFFDVACLAFACYAVGADPRMAGVLIAFAVGKAVGSIPLAPGGLVFVDATLIAALTSAASISASQAVAAAFVYRIVSFILVAIVGWIVFLFLFRKHQHEDLEYDVELEQSETSQMRPRD